MRFGKRGIHEARVEATAALVLLGAPRDHQIGSYSIPERDYSFWINRLALILVIEVLRSNLFESFNYGLRKC